jgi:hypothetical protein
MTKTSISNLLQLLNKPALIGWANRMGLSGVDINKSNKESLYTGTNYHNQIQAHIINGDEFKDKQLGDNFRQFIADKEVLSCECDIETDYFVGRYDLEIKVNSTGKIIIVDFKTTDEGANKKLYIENKLQLIAYGMAKKCDGFAVVTLPDFIYIPFEVSDRTPYEEIIKSLSNIYSLKKQIDNGTNY